MHFLEDPSCDLLEFMPMPDFSTGGEIIYRREEMERIIETGLGSFQIRSRWRWVPEERIIGAHHRDGPGQLPDPLALALGPRRTHHRPLHHQDGRHHRPYHQALQRGQGARDRRHPRRDRPLRPAHRHRPQARRRPREAHGQALSQHHAARFVLLQLQRAGGRLPARHVRAPDPA